MPRNENLGCLGQLLLGWFAPRSTDNSNNVDEIPSAEDAYPYLLRDDFLTPAERSLYGVMNGILQGKAIICPKVRLGDLFFVTRDASSNQASRNRIERKHVDFVLCDPATMKPLAAVELDDKSHEAQHRKERDHFVDGVFEAAGLPLIRITAKRQYNVAEIGAQLTQALTPKPPPLREIKAETPTCPKCRTPMIRRTASKGSQKGNDFWGCKNYPNCRQRLPTA
jgi:hypothetical protein